MRAAARLLSKASGRAQLPSPQGGLKNEGRVLRSEGHSGTFHIRLLHPPEPAARGGEGSETSLEDIVKIRK